MKFCIACQRRCSTSESPSNSPSVPVPVVVEAVDAHTCRLHVGAASPSDLVWMITSVNADFTLTSGPPELADAFRAQADRCRDAVAATTPPRRR